MYTYAQIQMSERQNFCTKAKLNFFFCLSPFLHIHLITTCHITLPHKEWMDGIKEKESFF